MLLDVTTSSGGISNGGVISAGVGMVLSQLSTFVGGSGSGGAIVNSGKLTAAFDGIRIGFVDSFDGGIANSKGGAITAQSGVGIFVGGTLSPGVVFVSSFSGGITNAGTISAGSPFGRTNAGVLVENASLFAGGIVNNSSGLIAAVASGIGVKQVATFTGGISNSGKLTVAGEGILVSGVAVFGDTSAGGGIVNSGTISAADQGIFVKSVTTFAAGIVNSGKLGAQTGISVSNFVFFGAGSSGGGITNRGTITASDHGIVLQNGADFAGVVANSSVIAAHTTGIKIDGVSTLSGGVSNSGTITGTVGDGIQISHTQANNPIPGGLVSGGITNSGTISAAGAAIEIFDTATFAGGISNSGRLAAAKSIAVTGVGFFGDSSAGGGITNTGTMQGGINLQADRTFFGSIVNGSAGKIISGGINFNDGTLFGAGSVAGGITNAGTISLGGGINVHTATFLGNISNSGKIIGHGIGLSSVAIFGGSDGGSIVNSNVISATQVGLRLKNVGTFAGGITNAGVISAGGSGIEISRVGTLSGGIVNSGTIAGRNVGIGILGLGVDESTVAGGIIDNGTLKGGIVIDFSKVLASGTAIDIAGPTFTGGINIFGAVISGSVGIEIKSAHGVSIVDGGTIIGTGGTAIEFAGSGNTLTLEAGYTISGTVDPQSGNNTFQLGGFNSGTFDLSSIGTQYKGFTIFNVVGGTWTVSSASTAHWTIESGGALEITSGHLTSTTVSSGSVLMVNSGATASSTLIKSGGTGARPTAVLTRLASSTTAPRAFRACAFGTGAAVPSRAAWAIAAECAASTPASSASAPASSTSAAASWLRSLDTGASARATSDFRAVMEARCRVR